MQRTFHPVGQGAFYSEHLKIDNENNFNIVFDCGSNNKKQLLSCINNYVEKKIDILFISHFHADHINGIKDLCKGRTISKVIMPYIDSIDKLICIGGLSQKELASGLHKFILNPESVIENCVFIKVKSDSDNSIQNKELNKSDLNHEEINANGLFIDKLTNNETISSGTRLYLSRANNNCKWIYVPITINYNEKKDEFIKLLIDKKILQSKDDTINITVLTTKIEDITAAYKKVFGTSHMNNTSLALYSGCNNNHECKKKYIDLYNKPNGCLYLGDIHLIDCNISDKILQSYSEYKNSIGIIQIPHHGSNTADQSDFWKEFINRTGIISFGENNRYRHPHKKTITTLLSNRLHIYGITECKKSILVLCDFCLCYHIGINSCR